MKEIKFKKRGGGICKTECKHFPPIRIGSTNCKKCKYNGGIKLFGLYRGIVKCKYIELK